MDQPAGPMQLVVFSDDWGRHPSSCQHLVGRLLPEATALWVNTIGMRRPSLSAADLRKVLVKCRQWLRPGRGEAEPGAVIPPGLRVISPPMYPGFRRRWQRLLNARLIARRVNQALGPRADGRLRVALTTLPITADLVGRLEADRWVYYCVDDFSVWPGLDGRVMDEMERRLVATVDASIAVSPTLKQRLVGMGRKEVELLTHGIDTAHWQGGEAGQEGRLPEWWQGLKRPVLLFWGMVDRRLDVDWCLALARQVGTLVLAGPVQDAAAELSRDNGIVLPGAVDYASLPRLARAADALVMPYADLPVTRAMQPLKLKEYLATGRPAIVRRLPATAPWSDAADVVGDIAEAVAAVGRRLSEGVPPSQHQARRRLEAETWTAKAHQLHRILAGRGQGGGGGQGGQDGPDGGARARGPGGCARFSGVGWRRLHRVPLAACPPVALAQTACTGGQAPIGTLRTTGNTWSGPPLARW